jgi:hypothetical protein
MKKALLIVAGILFFLTGAWAHGGHSAMESDLGHYLTSPDHLFLAILILPLQSWVAHEFHHSK